MVAELRDMMQEVIRDREEAETKRVQEQARAEGERAVEERELPVSGLGKCFFTALSHLSTGNVALPGFVVSGRVLAA